MHYPRTDSVQLPYVLIDPATLQPTPRSHARDLPWNANDFIQHVIVQQKYWYYMLSK